MRILGLYVSDHNDGLGQSYHLSEPAYILIHGDNTIKSIDISSHPGGGRVNIDRLLEGYVWELLAEQGGARILHGSK